MLSRLLLGSALAVTAWAQTPPNQMEVANLREDVRLLSQRVANLTLRVEQLERDNGELRTKAGTADTNFATLVQLNNAIADLNRDFKATVASAKAETLQQVGAQMEKLANQTNAALDSLAKAQAARTPLQAGSAENNSKESTGYIVQKGDTLGSIAKKTGAKLQDLVNANKLADPSHLEVGQTLIIPNPGAK